MLTGIRRFTQDKSFGQIGRSASAPKAMLPMGSRLEGHWQINSADMDDIGPSDDRYKEFKLEDLQLAPAKLDDLRADVQDELLEVNLGTEDEPRH